MFVIDANKKNSWHWFDSVSWVYDFPMWWEYYTMFDHNKEWWFRTLCGWYNYFANRNDLNIACTDQWYWKFFCDWSWKCDDYTDVAWAMVYTTDWDVLFPFHAMWNFCFQPSSCCYFWANCVYLQGPTIKFECMDAKDCTFAPIWYDLSNSIIYNIASRKQFKWWETVWKKINWDIYYMYNNYFCNYYNWDRFYAWWPISVKMSIWLLHTDWTISDIFSKTITTRCYFDNAPECSCSSCNEFCIWMFIQWQQSTDWVVACAWDRLIYDIRFPNWATYCPRVRYRNSSACIAALNLWTWFTFSSYVVPKRFNKSYCYVTNVFKPNEYCTNANCYSCAWSNLSSQAYSQLYTQEANIRQNWITVSIE